MIIKDFAEKITTLRINAKLSQIDFAKLLNKSRTMIAYWENGKRTPTIDQINEISKVLNIKHCWLCGEAANGNNPVAFDNNKGSVKNKTIIAVSNASLAKQRAILELLDAESGK